ncbi:MAG: winged helix-turn-helix transcriptional regulator, partial [Clostridiales bacterium]|nr:winged helix-turn-helix transcriptional regulator [Clostridiales bacterium]
KVLADNLQELEADGLVERTVYPEVPLRVEYRLTDNGQAIIPLLESVYDWGWHQMKNKSMEIDAYGEMWHGYREKDLEFMNSIDKRVQK